jgi:hypothetical protein
MYFTYLDLPPLPTELEEQLLALVEAPIANFHDSDAFVESIKNRTELNIGASEAIIDAITNVEYNAEDSLGYPLADAWEHFKDLAHFDFLEVNEALNEWARANIDPNVAHVSIQAMYGGTTITPHIDEMRSYAFNYVVATGGNSRTCFYKPKAEYSHLRVYPQTVFPIDRLELVDEIQIEPHRWHRLDTTTIHSVENLDPQLKRISLSLSFI